MNLSSHYETALRAHGYEADPAQQKAVAGLEKLFSQLSEGRPGDSWLRSLPGIKSMLGPVSPYRGMYMWGGVGRGKTFVMDVFYEALPFEDKSRFHFHRLMYRVHNQLKQLQGETNPLDIVAEQLAENARVICFDEFFVAEIGDAMILAKLLEGLFSRGVTLVATSNIPPDELYKDGLQRQQFLPAIALLQKHTHVLHLDSDTDYRLRVLSQAEIWHSPLNGGADENLAHCFDAIACDAGTRYQDIEILGRQIPTQRRATGVVWFDFAALCDGPRSQNDYIEIARAFHTVVVSDIPELNWEREDQARRFIAAVDEFYDRRVKLIVSAAQPITALYSGKRLMREFERTQSRLLEMQSHDYLAAAHLP